MIARLGPVASRSRDSFTVYRVVDNKSQSIATLHKYIMRVSCIDLWVSREYVLAERDVASGVRRMQINHVETIFLLYARGFTFRHKNVVFIPQTAPELRIWEVLY